MGLPTNIPTLADALSAYFLSRRGTNTMRGNIVPDTANLYDIGTSSTPLRAIYVQNLSYSGSFTTHTHATDGQGGQLDWDSIWSDAVHNHSSNAEGGTLDGTLDWDTVWLDAVHSHASDAEGGTSLSGVTLTAVANVTVAAGGALRTSTVAGNTLLLQAYDVNDADYTTFGTLTAGNIPSFSVKITGGDITGITDLAVDDGGTGVSTFALNGVLYGNAANAIGVTAIGAEGQILRVGVSPFVPAWTTATYPATIVAGVILHGSATNVVTGLAISAPAATFMNYVGAANGDTIPAYKALFDATVPGTIAESASAAAGTAVVASRRDHVHGAPATWAATAHNVLSATHGDSTAAACVRGDIITGQAVSPLWKRLAKGAAGAIVTANADDVLWSTYLLTGTAGGTTTFAVTNAKTLTLTATDSYNLTIPATGTAVLTSRTITSGSGLSGGGDLSADRTLAVGAGTLITVGADDVGISVGSAQYQFIVTGAAATYTPAWSTGFLNITATKTLAVELDSVLNQDLTTDAGPSFDHLHSTIATGTAPLVVASTTVVANLNADTVDAMHGVGTAQYQIPISGANPYTGAWTLISTLAGAGLTSATGVLAVGAGLGITVNADDVALTTPGTLTVSSTNSATGSHTHAITSSANPGVAASLLASDASGYLTLVKVMTDTLADKGGGNLIISPAGNVVFDPTGNDILPNTTYDLNVGSLSKKYLSLHAAELWVETLVAQDTIATIGGRILIGPTTQLTVALGDAVGDTTITVKHNQMSSGNRAYMEANGKVEFMSIDSAPDGAGPYTYTVTRDLDGTGRNTWDAGDAVFNTGSVGDGFIDIYSIDSVKSATQYGPTIVGNVRNSDTYNDWTECWAIGRLDGVYGYAGFGSTYGAAFGKYATDNSWIGIDSTNGIRMMNGTGTKVAQWDISGNILIGQVAASQSNVYITAGALHLRNNTTDKILLNADGTAYFTGNVTIGGTGANYGVNVGEALLLAHYDGPRPYETDYSGNANGQRGQVATKSGGVIFRPGKFGKAVQVAEATTNLVTDPLFAFDAALSGWAKWSGDGLFTAVRDSTFTLYGGYVAKCVAVTNGFLMQYPTVTATPYTLSVYARNPDGSPVISANIYYIFDNAAQTPTYTAVGGGWYLLSYTGTPAAGTSTMGFISTGTVYLSGAQLENKGYRTPFCSGDLSGSGATAINGNAINGHCWTGARNASTSTRTAATLTYPTAGNISATKGTIAVWFYVDHIETATYRQLLLDSYNDGTGNGFYVVLSGSVANFQVEHWGGSSAATRTIADPSLAAWHLLTVVWDDAASGDNRLLTYIDGALSGTFSGTYGTLDGAINSNHYIGSDRTSGSQINGFIDDLCILPVALSAAEVKAIYDSNAPLSAETNTGELRLMSATANGGYVFGNANGLFGVDASGTSTFGLTTAALNANLWGDNASESLASGAVMMGSNKTGYANVLWDPTAKQVQLRTGVTTTVYVDGATGDAVFGIVAASKYNLMWDASEGDLLLRLNTTNAIALDGSAATITIGAAATENVYISSTAVQIRDGATDVYTDLTAGVLTLGLVSGGEYVTVDGTNGIQLYGNGTSNVSISNAGAVRVGSLTAETYMTLDSTDGFQMIVQPSALNPKTRFQVQNDGDLFMGTDISAAATTNLVIFANAQTYNGEAGVFGVGDLLLGDNTASKANLWWDKSAGKLNFRGGVTTQAYVDTTGAITAGAGAVTLDTTGISITGGKITLIREEAAAVVMSLYGHNASGGCWIKAYGSQGTHASPTSSTGNDYLFSIDSYGYYTGAYYVRAQATVFAAENWTATAQGTKWVFDTTNVGTTTIRQHLLLDGDGLSIFAGGILCNGGLYVGATNVVPVVGTIEMPEISAPGAGPANNVRVYCEDNGAGKSRLMAVFPSGAAQQLAIEP